MIPLPNTKGSLSHTGGRKSITTERLDGAAQVMVLPASPRSWSVTADGLRPDEAAMFEHAASGALGVGPMWFLTAQAVQHNVMTPDMVAGRGVTGAQIGTPAHTVELIERTRVVRTHGTMIGPDDMIGPDTMLEGPGWKREAYFEEVDGFAPVTIIPPTQSSTLPWPKVPAPTGGRLSASIFARGAATLAVTFHNASGSLMPTFDLATGGGESRLERISGSIDIPSNVVAVSLLARGASWYANPAVSWTRHPVRWAPGRGCDRAWMSEPSWSVDQTGSSARESASVSVIEVAA